jgi:cell division septal protein FtsQ
MLLVSESKVKKSIESDPMLRLSAVKQEYPSTVTISYIRRNPAAYVPLTNGCLLIDSDGLVIMQSDSIPIDVPMISSVIVPEAYWAKNTDLTSVSGLSAILR